MHQRVAPAAPGGDRGILLAGPLDHDLLDSADAGLVGEAAGALDHPPQPLVAVHGHVVGNEPVAHLGGRGAGPGREDEREGAVVAGLGRHLQGLLEVLVGLAGEPDDDIGGHG